MIKKSIDLAGRKLILETGRMARQASGSIIVTWLPVFAIANASKEPVGPAPSISTEVELFIFFPNRSLV